MKVRRGMSRKPVAEPDGAAFAAQVAAASGLLSQQPEAARRLAEEILEATPGHPHVLLILGSALRRLGRDAQSAKVLGDLLRDHPSLASAHYELGLILRQSGDLGAVAAFRTAALLKLDMIEAWNALGDRMLTEAAVAIGQGRAAEAAQSLSVRLQARPSDVAAMRLLAESHNRLRRPLDALGILSRCLDQAPNTPGVRQAMAQTLIALQKPAEALVQIDRLLRAEPANLHFMQIKAIALGFMGEEEGAISLYQDILAARPASYGAWLSYGHALKAAGRPEESAAAYRSAIRVNPGSSRGYWGLANLKTVRFSDEDVAAMRTAVAEDATSDDGRLHLHFALGQALEDRRAFEDAFGHYQEGGRIRRRLVPYEADKTTARFARARQVFTSALFNHHRGSGNPAPDPIFIVGLPRSGSTLVEQILSSHSRIEGTRELVELPAMVRRLDQPGPMHQPAQYPAVLENLDPEALHALGLRYMETTRQYRKTGRPFFIDKTPANFEHVGFIHLILPNAKIIDVRREAMGNCFSAFKQHFASGHNFSYSLEDVGRYYNDYVRHMDHFDAVLPSRVFRVRYEDLVDDPEREIRKLLDYCGLPFEPACVSFHENTRPVRTPSAEQVRRPMFRDSLDQWRQFEPWLQPLKDIVGYRAE